MWTQHELSIATHGRGFYELTQPLAQHVAASGLRVGLCHLFLQHTSASLCICENADPEVQRDLERFAQRLAPDGDPLFRHVEEGPDDMPGHVRTLYAGYELTVPVRDGRLLLGTWQGIYVWEHRHSAHQRRYVLTLNGEPG